MSRRCRVRATDAADSARALEDVRRPERSCHPVTSQPSRRHHGWRGRRDRSRRQLEPAGGGFDGAPSRRRRICCPSAATFGVVARDGLPVAMPARRRASSCPPVVLHTVGPEPRAAITDPELRLLLFRRSLDLADELGAASALSRPLAPASTAGPDDVGQLTSSVRLWPDHRTRRPTVRFVLSANRCWKVLLPHWSARPRGFGPARSASTSRHATRPMSLPRGGRPPSARGRMTRRSPAWFHWL